MVVCLVVLCLLALSALGLAGKAIEQAEARGQVLICMARRQAEALEDLAKLQADQANRYPVAARPPWTRGS